MLRYGWFVLFLFSFSALSFSTPSTAHEKTVIDYQYRVITSYDHDTTVFTQGLEILDGKIYESSGLYGRSRLFRRTLSSSTPQQQHSLKRRYFAEGLTVLDNKIYQLTWRANTGFVYDQHTLEPLGQFRYQGEGWGLCNDGQSLILSNGSHQLQFLNAETFVIEKTVDVTLAGKKLPLLNELEWVNGLIYANVWQTDWIVMIDPTTGKVVGRVNLKNLLPAPLQKGVDVLNGIAYDKTQKRLYITGKLWPKLYQIELYQEATDKP